MINLRREILITNVFFTFLLHSATCTVDISVIHFIGMHPFLIRMTRSDTKNLVIRKKFVTVSHFVAENFLDQTIYNIIHKHDTCDFAAEKSRRGRPRKMSTGEPSHRNFVANSCTKMQSPSKNDLTGIE